MKLKQYIKESLNINQITKDMALSNSDKATKAILVWVKTKPFDEAFKRDKSFYIGKGGSGNSIGDRYQRFKELIHMDKEEQLRWLSKMEQRDMKIAVSNVEISPEGRAMFGNGRHRYAVLRDLGAKKIPVAMSRESMQRAKKYNLLA